MPDREQFELTVRPTSAEDAVPLATRLEWFLAAAKRVYGIECINVRELKDEPKTNKEAPR